MQIYPGMCPGTGGWLEGDVNVRFLEIPVIEMIVGSGSDCHLRQSLNVRIADRLVCRNVIFSGFIWLKTYKIA